MDKETRFNNIEIRKEGEELILEGYPVVFNSETYIGDEDWGFFESVDKRAFEGANIKDVPLKYNHNDSALILARTRNHTLELSVDEHGLRMVAKLQPDVQTHRDVYAMVQSGLIDKMSFAFTIKNDSVKKIDGKVHRTITGIDRLFDVSVVDIPAYEQTNVFARSKDLVETELKQLESRNSDELEIAKIKARAKSY